MTTLREAAQQALEALELVTDLTNHDDEIYYAIDALRAALAEPTLTQQMTDAGFTPRDNRLTCDECGGKFTRQMLPIHKCAALTEPVQDVKGCDVCEHPLYAGIKCRVCGRVTQAKPVQERNFCPRCGKRLQAKSIHTCTPPGGSDE